MRRRRVNNDTVNASMASTDATNAASLPGSKAIWNDDQRVQPVNSISPWANSHTCPGTSARRPICSISSVESE